MTFVLPLPLALSWASRPERTEVVPHVPSPDLIDDEALVQRAVQGDRWAEEALYRRYVRYVGAIALRLLQRRADAEDLVQETFVVALEQLPRLRNGAAVRGWLAQIVVSLAHRRFRRRKLLAAVGLDRGHDDATMAEQADPHAGPEVRAELARLDVVLSKLPASVRTAWILCRVEGLELMEAALACECSLATLKRRVAAGDARVREHVSLAEVTS